MDEARSFGTTPYFRLSHYREKDERFISFLYSILQNNREVCDLSKIHDRLLQINSKKRARVYLTLKGLR